MIWYYEQYEHRSEWFHHHSNTPSCWSTGWRCQNPGTNECALKEHLVAGKSQETDMRKKLGSVWSLQRQWKKQHTVRLTRPYLSMIGILWEKTRLDLGFSKSQQKLHMERLQASFGIWLSRPQNDLARFGDIWWLKRCARAGTVSAVCWQVLT